MEYAGLLLYELFEPVLSSETTADPSYRHPSALITPVSAVHRWRANHL